jgi:glucosamine kinase
MSILIADSGSTKCEWCLVSRGKRSTWFTQGMSPYFLTAEQMENLVRTELMPKLPRKLPSEVHFYGTGNKNPENARRTRTVLRRIFKDAKVTVDHDLLGAARALCQQEPGVACILGTGSNSCSYNGRRILKNSPGLGYVLGDEGSGAYLGRKVIQYYLYDIFEPEIKAQFEAKYHLDASEILENVYQKPLPNRYLAGFARFLGEHRGHYMIENILEDGLNDFFYHHVSRYPESMRYPIHFTGSIAWHFRDVVQSLCEAYGMKVGSILKQPMQGLISYHTR